jgi:hypothetical protein
MEKKILPLIELKLEAIREFQKKHPTAHVGGSFGLMLRGVNLQRDLSESDVDMTMFEEFTITPPTSAKRYGSSNDFDYIELVHTSVGDFVKIDVRVNPEPSFDVIEYQGHMYNVSKLRDILFWKQKYADKGVEKHIADLRTLRTGVRNTDTNDFDDLPF